MGNGGDSDGGDGDGGGGSSLSAASSASSSLSSSLSSSGNQTASLRAYMGALGEAQRDALRGIVKGAIKRMGEERQMSATLPMFEILGYSEVYRDEDLYSVDWFADFPKDIPYGCVVAAYKLMEQF